MAAPTLKPAGAKITVIFLLYNAERTVPMLVNALSRQKHPDYPNQSDWLEAVFMDDASPDSTARVLDAELARLSNPSHYRVVRNQPNLGLSRTLNKAFDLVRTPFVVTCHCDCEFGHEGYVAGMLQLLETHPEAGAITGQPIIPQGKALPLAEKINLVANLQDIFPAADEDLVPVGFAEGRCDAWRVDAMKAVGGYDTNLRLAGEDQVIAAKMREKGYEVYIAPRMIFTLSVSEEQDTLGKLAKHMRLYGRAHPYVLLMSRGTQTGVVGKRAGGNRSARTLLRAQQIAATAVYLFAALGILTRLPGWLWGGPVLGLLLIKIALFARHFRAVRFSLPEYIVYFSFQPYLDLSYTIGVAQGLWLIARGGTAAKPIS